MTGFLAFFLVTQAAAVGALLTRRLPTVSLAVGLGGLALASLSAIAIVPGESASLGGMTLGTTAYLRLFLVLASVAGSLLAVVGLATTWQRNVPAATLAALGWTGLALALPDALGAVLAALCAGLAGILVTLVAPVTARGVDVSARELRAVAVAGAIAIVGVVVVAAPSLVGGVPPADTLGQTVLGLGYLAVAAALALRFGVIPFHVWAGRLSQAAPEAALPLLLAWAPAGFGVVALAWVEGAVAPLGATLGLERGLVVAAGALTLLLGTFAVWIQDDLEHVVGYSIVQDAGFVVLGLAVLGPDGWEPTRTWIAIFALAKTALAAWALALEAVSGSRRLDELGGWARRSPALGLGLLAIVVATIGWPGSPAWVARWDLVRLSISEPLSLVVLAGAFGSLAYYGRLGWIGLRAPDGAGVRGIRGGAFSVAAAGAPGRSVRRGARQTDGGAAVGGAATRALPSAEPASGGPAREEAAAGGPAGEKASAGGQAPSDGARWWSTARASRLRGSAAGSLDRARGAIVGGASRRPGRPADLRARWSAERPRTATALVLALAILSVAAAAGWPGIPEAARGAPPADAAPSAMTGPGGMALR